MESIRISLNIKITQQENYGEERHINIQYRNTEKIKIYKLLFKC